MENILIRIEHLQVSFRTENETTRAVDDITFDLSEGATLAIVGESGSGKSVSALSIMRLLPVNAQIASNSKISFRRKNGQLTDLSSATEQILQQIRGHEIAMIFQEPMTSLNPLMRCGEQVAESIRLHLGVNVREAKQKTLALFEEVKIPFPEAAYDKYPHELSGGQKQRVMIAMAISCQPKLLIADEPTTALDVTVQKSILELLKELQQKYGMSILFITHDLHLVKRFADEVLVMYKSKGVEYGKCADVFAAPKHPYTKSLINCRPPQEIRVKILPTVAQITADEKILHQADNIISPQAFAKRMAMLDTRETYLQLKDLQVWYSVKRNFLGKTTAWYKAVQGVDMQIRRGETMGLVGESGCGKTTIGKAIVKLTDIHGGEILYKGRNIADFNRHDLMQYRRAVQIIFQDPYSSLNPRMTVGQAIKEPMDVHGLESAKNRKSYVISLLEKVGLLPEHYDRYPHEFSGGQRQRISIARALSLNAECMICDESVSALDVSVQAQVLNLLVSLREEYGFTYLFISHDLGVIRHISDHVTVMHQGRVTECKDAETLYRQPGEAYTKTLLSAY